MVWEIQMLSVVSEVNLYLRALLFFCCSRKRKDFAGYCMMKRQRRSPEDLWTLLPESLTRFERSHKEPFHWNSGLQE